MIPTMSIIDKSAVELLALLSKGDIIAESVVDAYLTAIAQREPKVKAYLHIDDKPAREQAVAIDARRKRGEKLGSLAGLPIAGKFFGV